MSTLSLPVAILAGGLATRMRPMTETIPKSLLLVAGRPFLAHQLELLHRQGVRKAVLCVGHLGDMIRDDFGNGSDFGVELDYSFDGPKLLGTGGAIKQALPKLGDRFFVLYGDSYLPLDWEPVQDQFLHSGRHGLMTVYRNEGRYDTSNLWFADGEIKVYDKTHHHPEMRHIDYGLSALQASVLEDWPADRSFDLAEVLVGLVKAKQLAGYEVHQRFYEIGSPDGLAELEAFLEHF